MAELKTRPTRRSVRKFISQIEHPVRRADCEALSALMTELTGEQPVLWGDSIVGFGRYHYRQRNGQPAMWPLTGFSPRKQNLVVYIMPGFAGFSGLMKKLGKYKTGKSCLYINKLDDVDEKVLQQLIERSVKVMHKRYNVK